MIDTMHCGKAGAQLSDRCEEAFSHLESREARTGEYRLLLGGLYGLVLRICVNLCKTQPYL